MEIYHEFGNDLVLTDTGDLRTADGIELTNQRIIRRLLTTPITVNNPPDYLDNPTYGAGLAQFIGQLNTPDIVDKITALITSQIFLEDEVAQSPPPVITISGLPNQLTGSITYTHILTNSQAVVNFQIPSTPATNFVIPTNAS